jgi:hypothetical protein
MASKPFYSMSEVRAKLGKTEDEIKALVRDGTLREFRDAGKIFFKAEDIDKLAAPPSEADDTGEIVLEPAEGERAAGIDDGLPNLADDTSGGTSIIGLEPLEEEQPEEEKKKKEDTVITASGIGVFDDDELEIDADPMAKTHITTGATDDQISLEGAGSGSGLLDLAREADDTALGADLLDEIYPGEEESAPEEVAEAPVAEAVEEAVESVEELEETEPGEVVMPAAPAVATDTSESLFAGLVVGVLVLMAVAGTVVAGAMQGFMPGPFRVFGDLPMLYYFMGGAVVLVGIAMLVGWFVGNAMTPRRR